jgi:hypothetical protein
MKEQNKNLKAKHPHTHIHPRKQILLQQNIRPLSGDWSPAPLSTARNSRML